MGHKLYISLFLLGLVVGGLAGAAERPPSMFFVANEGQWEEPFAFKLSVGATTYFITDRGLTIDIRENPKSQNPNPNSEDRFRPGRDARLGGMHPPYPPNRVGGEFRVSPNTLWGDQGGCAYSRIGSLLTRS